MPLDADITLFLNLAQDGDRGAENHVIRLVYDRLRTIAGALISKERAGHTLQATALVSETFVRKLRGISAPFQSREHFYSLASYAMRQVLVEHSRCANAQRRRLTPQAIAEVLAMHGDSVKIVEERMAVQQAFRALAAIDRNAARCIQCRFVSGLTIRQTALQLRQPEWKVRDDCEFALNWMAERLGRSR